MKIYALRHGLTKYNELGKTNGQTIEDPLSEKGLNQAEEMIKSLPLKVDVIFTSDLLRARQTAEIINAHLKAKVIETAALREIHLGSLTGLSWQEINNKVGRDILGEYKSQHYTFEPWGGESFEQMKDRVSGLLMEIKNNYSDKTVLIVTHGGVVRLLNHLFRNLTGQTVIANLAVEEFEI